MGSSEWILYKGVAAVQQGHVQSNKTAVMSRLEHLEKKERPDELPQVSMKLPDAGKIRAKNAAAIRHLTVSYGERIVLDNVSLEIEAGRRTFITGNNGAGKSTLIKALIDRHPKPLLPPKQGSPIFPRTWTPWTRRKPCWKMCRRMRSIPSISAGPSCPTSI